MRRTSGRSGPTRPAVSWRRAGCASMSGSPGATWTTSSWAFCARSGELALLATVDEDRGESGAALREAGVYGDVFCIRAQQEHHREESHDHVYREELGGAEAGTKPHTPLGEQDHGAQPDAPDRGEVGEQAEDEGDAQRQLSGAHELGEELGVRHHITLHEILEERRRLRDEAPGLQAGRELARKFRVEQLLQATVEPYGPNQDTHPHHAVHVPNSSHRPLRSLI